MNTKHDGEELQPLSLISRLVTTLMDVHPKDSWESQWRRERGLKSADLPPDHQLLMRYLKALSLLNNLSDK